MVERMGWVADPHRREGGERLQGGALSRPASLDTRRMVAPGQVCGDPEARDAAEARLR